MLWFFLGLSSSLFKVGKSAINKELTKEMEVVAVSSFIYLATAILFLFHILLFSQLILNLEVLLYSSATAFIASSGMYFTTKGLKEGEFSIVYPLLNASPLISIIVSFLILGEIPGLIEFIGIVLIVAGAVLVITKNYSLKDAVKNERGALYGILAATFYGSSFVTGKKAVLLSNEASALFLVYLIGGILLLINGTIKRKEFRIKIESIKKLSLASLLSYLENITIAIAYPMVNAASLMAVKRSGGIFALLFSKYKFNEKNLGRAAIGFAILLIGDILLLIG